MTARPGPKQVPFQTFGTAPAGARRVARAAAYAVIRDGGTVAAVEAPVIMGGTRLWLPGGGSQPGEQPRATIEREVREELGRGVRDLEPIGVARQYFFSADDDCWYDMTATFFSARLDTGPASAPGDHPLRWVDPVVQEHDFFHASHPWAARLPSPPPPPPPLFVEAFGVNRVVIACAAIIAFACFQVLAQGVGALRQLMLWVPLAAAGMVFAEAVRRGLVKEEDEEAGRGAG